MFLSRDLALNNLDFTYLSSISYQFARFALGLHFELLPQEVVHQAKRCLLDALGCAIGAWDAPGRPILEAVINDMGGASEATLFGSGRMTSVLNATLFNSFLVRFLDYNDFGGGGHNSDAISGLIAVAEKEKTSGTNFLTSLVISYELGARVLESFTGSVFTNNWCIDARGGISMPPALGKLMNLNQDEIANAIGLCTSHSLPLNILDANREENTMAKNLRFGWVVYDAILSCLLSKKGFTGPVRVAEGDSGFCQITMRGEVDLERMVDFSGWRILNVRHKSMCANGTTQGHVSATLEIVNDNDLKAEDIASVRIRCSLREFQHTATLEKKYPRNAETADHSAFYMNAVAIKDRKISPRAFEPEKFTDPIILELIDKITIEADTNLPQTGPVGISEIITKDGRRFEKRVNNVHGMGNDPLTDQELEDKFISMAIKFMKEDQITQIFDTVWHIEKMENLNRLTSLFAFRDVFSI